MRAALLTSVLLCMLVAAATADTDHPVAPWPASQSKPRMQTEQAEAKAAIASWLSRQLRQPVDASQILVSPVLSMLAGCAILHARSALADETSLSLRCPNHVLPQLVLLKIPLREIVLFAARDEVHTKHSTPLVRAGAALEADWRTLAMHAEMPVVALDSGAAGAEIRVRVANTSRILRARILTAHSVAILAAGV